MRVVGIVGPAGSGKSTVCRILSRRPRILHINCDELAWETYRPGGPAYLALLSRFGEGILAQDRTVDRKKLGELISRDPKAKADLEAIVHPPVMEAVKERVAKARQEGKTLTLVEGALLLSSPHVDRSFFDAFVWLSVPEEERKARLLSAGLDEESVARRLALQADLLPPRLPNLLLVDGRGPPAEVARRVLSALKAYFEEEATSA
jgi:dephospho-CoA kinase